MAPRAERPGGAGLRPTRPRVLGGERPPLLTDFGSVPSALDRLGGPPDAWWAPLRLDPGGLGGAA